MIIVAYEDEISVVGAIAIGWDQYLFFFFHLCYPYLIWSVKFFIISIDVIGSLRVMLFVGAIEWIFIGSTLSRVHG
jgi:hypothetical protein